MNQNPHKAALAGVPGRDLRNKWSKAKKTLILTSMVAPGAIWLLLLRYLPMFGIVLAFKSYKPFPKNPTFINNLIQSKWVGLKNFQFLFMTGGTWTMIRNTVGYNALWIILGLVISVAFAIMLSQLTKKLVAKTFQTMMFFPYFLSWVVASYFLFAFIDATNGMLPRLQRSMGADVIDWYNAPRKMSGRMSGTVPRRRLLQRRQGQFVSSQNIHAVQPTQTHNGNPVVSGVK